MKRYLQIICLTLTIALLQACKGNDPEPVQPVVGKWSSDRIRISGLPAAYASSNGEYDAFTEFGIRNEFEVKTDKTFTGSDRSGVQIQDFEGTWDYSGTDLTLKYSDGDEQTLTYDASGSKARLLTEAFATQDSVQNPTTKQIEVVKYNIQLVYAKQ